LNGDNSNSVKIERKVSARIPTAAGEFQLFLYTSDRDDKEQLALVMGDVQGKTNVLVRVHSECFTGDVLCSLRCDCGEQLDRAIQMIAQKGEGVLIYLRQEGRGIGLLDKLRAYNLQDQGYDTVEANLVLGHQADEREYSLAARILDDLEVASVELLTNNPLKIEHLNGSGISVARRVPLEATVTADNAIYLFTKVQRMNHILHLEPQTEMEETNGNGSKNGAH
jgi:3,4-dihydroxy 2-butanone 4-phosphate synthase / GTP cyclohydrolase II